MTVSPSAVPPRVGADSSPWAPLRRPAFRAVWTASLVSNVGTWMQTVGAQWLLVDDRAPSAVVALVQTASALPVLLLTLPSGVVAEFVDRRRILVAAQCFQLLVGGLLAGLEVAGAVVPPVLLAFTFLLGCGAAVQMPAYQAYVPDLVLRAEIGAAASLGSVAVNLARAVGPAIAGLLIVPLGVGGVFALNAATFAVFAVALLRAPSPGPIAGPRHTFLASLEAGGRYVRHAPAVRRMMLRLVLFAFPAGVLWALLAPLAAQRLALGASGYGALLGAAGVGSVVGALVLPRLRRRLSSSALLVLAGVLSGLSMLVLGLTSAALLVLVALLPAGVGWIAVIAGMNAAMQTFLPGWVRARALAFYQLVVFTTAASSAAVWGAVASAIGLAPTFLVSGVFLLLGAVSVRWWPLLDGDIGERAGPGTWTPPEVTLTPDVEEAPVRVAVRYHVAPSRREAFLDGVTALRQSRRRTGGTRWDLYREGLDGDVFVEEYTLPSWADYRDQNTARATAFDEDVLDRVARTADRVEAPVPRFLVAD